MKQHRWLVAASLTAVLGLGVLVQPTRADHGAPWCQHGQRCAGCSRFGGYCTGYVVCDPGGDDPSTPDFGCACPLPASDWQLWLNQCSGQKS
jgi:hypothetical protein